MASQSQIDAKRTSAARARRLAKEVSDPDDRERMIAFAEELEAQAEELQLQAANVVADCRGNLHSAWDTCLVVEALGDNVQEAATKLSAAVTAEQIQTWTQSEPKDWANETFKITESAQTKYCVKHGDRCDKPDIRVRIDQAYIDANVPIVKEQLQKAGIRLAALLDRALGDSR